MIKIIVKSEIIVTLLHCYYSIFNWHYKENSFILVLAHRASADDYHLILREILKKFKKYLFLCWWKLKILSVFLLENFTNKGQTYNKAYSVRFIDSMRLMKTFLNSHINRFSKKNYNHKYKHCLQCKDCKQYKECKDDAGEWYKKFKNWKAVRFL